MGLPVTTAFRANAAVWNHCWGLGFDRCGSPTRFARSLFVPSRFASTPFRTVNGKPLWYLTIGEIDHPFRTALAAAFLPYENAGCHTAETETACRWSMSARPLSSLTMRMFWAPPWVWLLSRSTLFTFLLNVTGGWRWSGRNQGIIHILCKWQIMGQAAYITHGDAQVGGELALHREIRLVCVRPLEIRGNAQNSSAKCVSPLIWEWISAGKSPIGIREATASRKFSRPCIGKRQTSSERLEIGRLIPIISGKAAIEDTERRSDGSFSIAEGIPCEPKSGRDVMVANGNDSAGYTGVSGE